MVYTKAGLSHAELTVSQKVTKEERQGHSRDR